MPGGARRAILKKEVPVSHGKKVPSMRKVADCRDYPSESNCTLTIAGEEDEVVRAAAEHAASVHGHADTPELREDVRKMLKDEKSPQAA